MTHKISIKEAVAIIDEWGVDCDNFVAHTYHRFMYGGEPGDNSIEMGNYFMKCLKIVCDLGIKAASQQDDSADSYECPSCGVHHHNTDENCFYCMVCGAKCR